MRIYSFLVPRLKLLYRLVDLYLRRRPGPIWNDLVIGSEIYHDSPSTSALEVPEAS